jgi:hypothetical protein
VTKETASSSSNRPAAPRAVSRAGGPARRFIDWGPALPESYGGPASSRSSAIPGLLRRWEEGDRIRARDLTAATIGGAGRRPRSAPGTSGHPEHEYEVELLLGRTHVARLGRIASRGSIPATDVDPEWTPTETQASCSSSSF